MVCLITTFSFTLLYKVQNIAYRMLSGSSTYLTEFSVLHKLTYPRLIEDFQKGETPTLIEHINCALRLLESQPNAMVVFSGCVLSRYHPCDIRQRQLTSLQWSYKAFQDFLK